MEQDREPRSKPTPAQAERNFRCWGIEFGIQRGREGLDELMEILGERQLPANHGIAVVKGFIKSVTLGEVKPRPLNDEDAAHLLEAEEQFRQLIEEQFKPIKP